MVENIHSRIINSPLESVGCLIDRLASRDDALWPLTRWPAMRFDRPLAVGARGGHGPIRYFVEAYEPGHRILFRFTSPTGYHGTHALEANELGLDKVQLRHVLKMRVTGMSRLSWPLAFRWLHDALVEDAFDRAESFCTSRPLPERALSPWVRVLRYLFASRGARAIAKRHADASVQK